MSYKRRKVLRNDIISEKDILVAPSMPSSKFTSINVFDRFCEKILGWRIIDEIKGVSKKEKDSVTNTLPCVFSSSEEYVSCWEPLMIEEIQGSIGSNIPLNTRVNAKKGALKGIQFEGSSNVLKLNCEIQVEKQTSEASDIRKNPLSSMDLLILSDKDFDLPLSKESMIGKTANWILGLVTRSSRTTNIAILSSEWKRFANLVKLESVGVGGDRVGSNDNSILSTKRFSYLVIDSLISSWREYLALFEVEASCRLLSHILNPAFQNGNELPELNSIKTLEAHGLPLKYCKYISKSFNPSQQKAIAFSTIMDGFSLVQGPPGTGKTATILGVLNSIHLKEYSFYHDRLIETLIGDRGMRARNEQGFGSLLNLLSELSKLKPHILVTAPSNVAVDNIIQRIFDRGFIDGNGCKYFPHLIRIGSGKSSLVESVALDAIVSNEMQQCPSPDLRRSACELLLSTISEYCVEITRLQTFLMNLKIAFLAHPLPIGWELRINVENSMPYWVDHINKTSTSVPPPEVGLSKVMLEEINVDGPHSTLVRRKKIYRNGDYLLDSLPEFQYYSYELTQLVEKVEKLHSQYLRLTSNHADIDRSAFETSAIDNAHIVFTTLNSAGHPSLEFTRFEVTLIDEAAQCVEPSVLIALRRGCRKCVMVGDPLQLPATIFSDIARQASYDRSLLERLMSNGHSFVMLDIQYRMDPAISAFPSSAFYSGLLQDGENVKSINYLPLFQQDKKIRSEQLRGQVPPLVFFDLKVSRDIVTTSGNLSRSNPEEAKFCVNLMRFLIDYSKCWNCKLGQVGIITPYSEQVIEIRRAFQRSKLFPQDLKSSEYDIEMNTVDAFQGREKDIVIISTVRSNDQGSIGFVSDKRRMNVALTRAKFGLFIIGNAETLKNNDRWCDLIQYCNKERLLWRIEESTDNIQVSVDRYSPPVAPPDILRAISSIEDNNLASLEEGEVIESS